MLAALHDWTEGRLTPRRGRLAGYTAAGQG
jgi:hypothetical protein